MSKACKQCGAPTGRTYVATYCMPCSDQRKRTRIAPVGKKRAGELAAQRINGELVCRDCAGPIRSDGADPSIRGPIRCVDCGHSRRIFTEILSGRRMAMQMVSKAKADGALTDATDHACVDCAAPRRGLRPPRLRTASEGRPGLPVLQHHARPSQAGRSTHRPELAERDRGMAARSLATALPVRRPYGGRAVGRECMCKGYRIRRLTSDPQILRSKKRPVKTGQMAPAKGNPS